MIPVMRLLWEISADDVARLRAFLDNQANNGLVKYRIRRNVTNRPTDIIAADVWHAIVACLLTTQQRSGPKSRVSQFLTSSPFPLSLDACRAGPNVTTLAQKVLAEYRGIRFAPKIASQLAGNLEWFDSRFWPKVDEILRQLLTADDFLVERRAARFIDHEFYGFGPKQSRNLLQMLGLTRYEIPLDSRVARWFNEFGFPVKLSPGALADEGTYEFLSDGIRELCGRAGVLPCVLDAAVFASYDGDGWNGLETIW